MVLPAIPALRSSTSGWFWFYKSRGGRVRLHHLCLLNKGTSHISKCISFSVDPKWSSLMHTGEAGGQRCTRSISVPTRYLLIRIPWLIVKCQRGEPFISHKKKKKPLSMLNMIVISWGKNRRRVSEVSGHTWELECCHEHQQHKYSGAPALHIL